MREGAANYQANFTVQFALFWLVLVVTLGSRTVEGAIEAALALKFFPEVLNALGVSQSWQFVLFGLGAVAFARHPEGILEYYKRSSLASRSSTDTSVDGRPADSPARAAAVAVDRRPSSDARARDMTASRTAPRRAST